MIAPIYLIESNEPLLAEETLDELHISLKNKGFSERIQVNIENGFDPTELNGLTQNFSLFAEKKRIQLNCNDKIPAAFSTWVLQYCQNIQEYSDLCLILKTPKLSSAEKKSKWVTEIQKAGKIITLYEVGIAEFPRWLDNRLMREKVKLTTNARNRLIEQTEGNLLAAVQIIRKLALLNQNNTLDLTDIEPLLAEDARYDLFDLSRHTLLGDLKRALRILDHLQKNAEPVLVLWVLSKELKTLLTIHTKKNSTPLPQLYQSLQIWDKRKAEIEAGLQRLNPKKTADLLASCAKIDLTIKGLTEDNPWQLLKDLVVNIASPNHPPLVPCHEFIHTNAHKNY